MASTTLVTWPAWLVPLVQGFSSEYIEGKHSFKPTVGPSIDRPTTAELKRRETWNVLLKGQRYQDFLTFFEVTSKQGSLCSQVTDLIMASETVLRHIVSVGQHRRLRSDIYMVPLEVEVLPTTSMSITRRSSWPAFLQPLLAGFETEIQTNKIRQPKRHVSERERQSVVSRIEVWPLLVTLPQLGILMEFHTRGRGVYTYKIKDPTTGNTKRVRLKGLSQITKSTHNMWAVNCQVEIFDK